MGVCRLPNYKYFYCFNNSSTYAAVGGRLRFQLFPYQVSCRSGLPRVRVLVCVLWSSGKPRAVHIHSAAHIHFLCGDSCWGALWQGQKQLPCVWIQKEDENVPGDHHCSLSLCMCALFPSSCIRETRGFNLWPARHETCSFTVFYWNLSFWKALLSLIDAETNIICGQAQFSSVTQWKCFWVNNEVA